MNNTQISKGKVIGNYLLLILGAALLAVAIWFVIRDIRYVTQYDCIDATISKMAVSNRGDDTQYDVRVSFTHNGKDYTDRKVSYNISMKEGKTIKVFLNPANDREQLHTIADMILLPFVFCLGGTIATAIGFNFIKAYSRYRQDGDTEVASYR